MSQSEQLFKCEECKNKTPLVYKTDIVKDDIEHTYAECQCCKNKVTVYYTNEEIRTMLAKQRQLRKTNKVSKQRKLAEEIQQATDKLKTEVVARTS